MPVIPAFNFTRRSFFGIAGAGGVSVLFHDLAQAKFETPALDQALPQAKGSPAHVTAAPNWSGAPGKARFRIEGLAKVTGQKIYARDFRAKDMPGWPAQERLAMVLRATQPNRVFSGINLSMLPPDLMPRLITQTDLATLHLTLPFSYTDPTGKTADLLTSIGATPLFYGQPVAILIFKDWSTFRRAKRLLQFNPEVVQYGDPMPKPATPHPYNPVTHLTRFENLPAENFSQVQDGKANPFAPEPQSPLDAKAKRLRAVIDDILVSPDYQQFGGKYHTQVLDPMFMEPEAGLAWLDKTQASGTLHLVLGTQATNGDMNDTFGLFAATNCPIKVGSVALHSCYPGGGFGGRDVSTFPPLLAVTAALSDAPVRIMQDRYEQFQSGLKQLDSHITQSLAVDTAGQFIAFKSGQILGAGGNNNYSQFVAALAGYCGLSGYNIKQAYVDAAAQPSQGVVAGSMRGFGGPQASFAVETLVDEAAVALKFDPIVLRERNVLHQGDRTITGAPLTQKLPLAQICSMARQNPLWTGRAAMQRRKASQGVLYGVGFALANQAYGTGSDGVMAEVALAQDGQLTVRTNCVDMGNGSATTLAISTAGFAGNNAAQVVMGDAGYFVQPLGMNSAKGGNWQTPYWTSSFSMSSSACLTAFHQVHVTEQASRVLFEAALLPAAAVLWGVPLAQVQGKTAWRKGQLTAPRLAALSMPALAAQVYQMKLCAAAMVHAVYQAKWVSATYTVNTQNLELPIDGLSIRHAGDTAWQPLPRSQVRPPLPSSSLYGRSLYAPSGALVAVEVSPATGEVKVIAVDLIVDAGKVLQRDLLIGQAQGGIAMGIGYALLEDLPLEAGGAGDGRWNLDRYHVALASDIPMRAINITTLPTTETTGKGIAEAVLCPIAPAIGNAIANATGKRFRSLPIRPAHILEALKS